MLTKLKMKRTHVLRFGEEVRNQLSFHAFGPHLYQVCKHMYDYQVWARISAQIQLGVLGPLFSSIRQELI